jgi:putative transposase
MCICCYRFRPSIGREESIIREYIRKQEVEDKRLEQMGLW